MTDRWLLSWGLSSVTVGGASLLVPLYLVSLGASPVQLGLLAAAAAGIGAPGAIVFGRLAERVGHRRPLVLLSLGVVAVAIAVIPLLEEVTAVIVVNTLLWLVVAAAGPVLTLLVLGETPEPGWSERIGQLNRYQGWGWTGGLVLGAVWQPLAGRFVRPAVGMDWLFWLLAVVAATSLGWGIRTLPREPASEGSVGRPGARRVARLLSRTNRGVRAATFAFTPTRLYWTTRGLDPRRIRARLDRRFAIYLLAAGLFFGGFAAFWAPLPLFLAASGFDTGHIFWLYLAASLGSALCYGLAGRLASTYDRRWLQAGALAVRGLLFPVVPAVAGVAAFDVRLWTAIASFAAIGVTWSVIAVVGTVIVTGLAPTGARGDALGIHTALAAVAGGVGGLLGGWLATFGFDLAFLGSGGLVLAGSLVVLTLRLERGDDGRTTPAGNEVA